MGLNNKKGVSEIVSTVLLILLAIGAIGILWGVFYNFAREGTEGLPGTAACLETSLEIVSVNNVGGATVDDESVTIKRTAGDAPIANIRVLVLDSSGTGTNLAGPSFGANLENGESVTTGTMTISDGDTVDVTAVITLDDGSTKSCIISDTAIA